MLEMLNFVCDLIYVSEVTVVSLCITSHSLSQNVITIMFLVHGASRSCAFPIFPSLTLFAQRPTVLLSTAAFQSVLLSYLWVFPTISFTATRNSLSPPVVYNDHHW
jgi:hypothetical protein